VAPCRTGRVKARAAGGAMQPRQRCRLRTSRRHPPPSAAARRTSSEGWDAVQAAAPGASLGGCRCLGEWWVGAWSERLAGAWSERARSPWAPGRLVTQRADEGCHPRLGCVTGS
jgi:hypothetical protein